VTEFKKSQLPHTFINDVEIQFCVDLSVCLKYGLHFTVKQCTHLYRYVENH